MVRIRQSRPESGAHVSTRATASPWSLPPTSTPQVPSASLFGTYTTIMALAFWHTSDSQGQILALASRPKFFFSCSICLFFFGCSFDRKRRARLDPSDRLSLVVAAHLDTAGPACLALWHIYNDSGLGFLAYIRQSRTDSGLGAQAKVLFQLFPHRSEAARTSRPERAPLPRGCRPP